MGTIYAVRKLRIIGNLPPPSLPTREITGARWHPQHRHTAVHERADKVPLPHPTIARTRYQDDALIEAANLDAEPSFVRAVHVRRDEARSNRLAGVIVRPTDPASFVRARLNKPSPRKPI